MFDNNDEEMLAKEQADREAAMRDDDDRRRSEEQAMMTAVSSSGKSSSQSEDKSVKKSFISAHTDEKVKNNMRSAKKQARSTVNESKQDGKAAGEQSGSILDILSPGQKVAVGALAVSNTITSLQMSMLSARMGNQPATKDSTSMASKAAEWQKLHDAAKMRRLKLMQSFMMKLGSGIQSGARTIGQHSRQKNNVDIVGAKGATDGAARSSFADVSNTGIAGRETPHIEAVIGDEDVVFDM